MDYFAGLDISMDETHVWVVDREARSFARQVIDGGSDRRRIGESAELHSHRIRDRADDRILFMG